MHSEAARPPARQTPRRALVGLAVVIAALAAALGHQSVSSFAPSFEILGADGHSELGEADGLVSGGASVFDAVAAIVNLDPSLLAALRRAASDAANDGVELQITSGWRSPAYQDELLREAISAYGSAQEAARWVATAETSPHVAGQAVDVRGFDAATWLSQHGARYGLCQIYRNEPWHYELRQATRGCPPMYADPTHDPRMNQEARTHSSGS
jgi:D-alanyl-D-alanine carboxypeptidase